MISVPFQRILCHQIQQILDQLRRNVHPPPFVISAEVIAIKSYVATLGCRTGSYRPKAASYDATPIELFFGVVTHGSRCSNGTRGKMVDTR